MIAVFATVRARIGRRDDLIAALRSGIEDAAAEPGTIVYAMHADLRDESLLHYYELYDSKEAFVKHAKAAGVRLNALADLLDGPPELTRSRLVAAKGLPPA